MSPETFILIGRSGSGKGTQATLIIDFLKRESDREVYYLQTGAAFREFIKGSTYTHELSRDIYKAGGLQPEFLTISIWSNLLIDNMKEGIHLVLDGTPRRVNEAKVLRGAIDSYHRAIPFIVFIKVSRDWSKERLLERGRFDDTDVEIEKRLNWFDSEVMPAVEYFKTSPDFHFLEINGEQPIDKVHKDIISAYRANN